MTIFLPLLIAIIGAAIYLFAVNPKFAELGRISFFAGLFVFLLRYGGQALSFFK